jgi:hypothetical protein
MPANTYAPALEARPLSCPEMSVPAAPAVRKDTGLPTPSVGLSNSKRP